MPILRIFVDNKSGEIKTELPYYKELYNKYVGKNIEEVEKYTDLFDNEYVRFYKNGEIVGEGLVQYFDKTNNIVKIKNSKINITSKIDKIQKIKFDVLGLYNLNI